MTALVDCFASAAANARAAITEAEEVGDMGSADIFTTYSLSLDKSLWFLEAHMQETE